MKFGRIDYPENIDYTLPDDRPDTARILKQSDRSKPLQAFVGCAKWNRQELKNFYPRGTKDELTYYATQFNSIELNATFYRIPNQNQVVTWKEKTPDGFKFFPKINQRISHIKRLKEVQSVVEEYCDSISHFGEKLGMVFLQLNNNFGSKNQERLITFVENFPPSIPLAVEIRNGKWLEDPILSAEVFQLFERHSITNVLVDTAGRRDLLHMRLTTPSVFIRYVGANDPAMDRLRLDGWIQRLKCWVGLGLKEINFFVHQNLEMESPLLAAYFIEKLICEFGLVLHPPKMLP